MRKGFFLALLLCQTLFLSAQLPGPGTCIGYLNFNQSIAVPSQTALNPTGNFTIEGWFLPTNTSATCCDNILIQKGNISNQNGFSLRTGALGDVRFQYGTGSSVGTLQSPTSLYLYTWNHVAATGDGNMVWLYVNGVPVDSAAQGGNIAANSDSLLIGDNFQGEIDEVRLWNTAIGGDTLRDWMCRKLSPPHQTYSSLVARWDFDDGSGTTLTDVSGNGHTGILQGGLMWGPSSAPLGDTSVWAFQPVTNISQADSLQLASPSGDFLRLNNYVNVGKLAQLYMVTEKASATVFQNGTSQYSSVDTTHYWGTFFTYQPNGFSPICDVHYFYNGNPYFNGLQECEIAMGTRPQANFPYWNPITPVSKDPVNDILSYSPWPRSEFIPATMNNPYGLVTSPDVDSICDGDSVQLITANAPLVSFQWYLNSSPITGATNNIYNAFQGGTYSLTVTDSECTFTSANLPITVLPLPSLSTPGSADVFLCDSILDLDTLVSPGGGTFMGSGVTGNSIFTNQAGVGIHSVLYTYTDSFGCTNSDIFPVEVKADPVPMIGTIATDYCENSPPLAMSGFVMPQGGVYGGPGVIGDSLYLSVAGPGVHILTYSLFTNTCTITDSTSISVVGTPPAPSINLNGTTLSTGAVQPTWYVLQGGIPVQVATGNPFTPTVSGTYAVTNTVFPGCESDLSDSLVVTIVGIDDPLLAQPIWYPDPFRENLNLKFPSAGKWEVRLIDMQGKAVLRKTAEVGLGEIGELRLGPFPAGLYLIEFRGPGDLLYLGKVLKE